MSDHAHVHALVRARMSAMISPMSFRSSVTRARYSHLSLQHTEFPSVDGAGATCFDLDRVERRYLLCGTVDGGAHVYDVETTSTSSDEDDAVRTQALVCAIPGGGARATQSRTASTSTSSVFISDATAHSYATSCAKWLPSDTGMFFTAGFDSAVKCWDANSLLEANALELEAKCHALALSSISTSHALVAIGTDDAVVRLWDPGANVIAHTLSGHRGSVRAIDWALSSEYQLATGGAEGDVRVWDIRRAGAFMILDRHNTQQTAHVEGIKDAMYAGSSGTTVGAGPKPASRKMADSIPDHLRSDAARRCSSSSYSGLGNARGGVKRTRDGGWGGWGVGFRPKNVARQDASTSKHFPTRDGYSSIAASAHEGQVTGLKVTPCGLFLISTGIDARVRRWDLTTGLNTYAPYDALGAIPTSNTCQLAISDDGERLFVPCTTGDVKVFNTHTGMLHTALKGHLDEAFACAHKDGASTLFSLGKDRNILVWEPPRACADPRVHGDGVIDGDAWSDDDDAEDMSTAGIRADPNSRFASRGLGYRSIRR